MYVMYVLFLGGTGGVGGFEIFYLIKCCRIFFFLIYLLLLFFSGGGDMVKKIKKISWLHLSFILKKIRRHDYNFFFKYI